MTNHELLARVIQACAQAAPQPLFPAEFAAQAGIERQRLDAAIDRLRLNGYIQIADWVQGKGQGYTLTEAGAVAFRNPALLDRPAPAPRPLAPARPRDASTWDRGEAIRAAFLKPAPPIVTLVLLFANLLMFAIGMSLALVRGIPLNEYLYGAGTVALAELADRLGSLNTEAVILHHEWWRVITYQFLHRGFLHLGLNMLNLYFLGPFLESLWGSKRFAVLYLLSGVMGGAVILLVGRSAVGASGAICGLFTSLAVWLWLNRRFLPEQILHTLLSRVGINLLLIAYISTWEMVSWEGHLGGALGGALLSVPLHYDRFGRTWQRLASWCAIAAIPVAALFAAWYVQQSHRAALVRRSLAVRYEQRFHVTESTLLRTYNRFLVPLLNRGADTWRNDPEFVPNLTRACDENRVTLKQLLDDLAAVPPLSDAATAEIRNVERYFLAWSELLGDVRGHLDDLDRWPRHRLAVASARRRVWDLRKPLESNQVLPHFPELKEVPDDPPPDPKPPPNTA